MKKTTKLVLYTLCILISFITGNLITQQILPAYAKKPGTGSYEIELQDRNGIPIKDYSWGTFTENEIKELECRIAYLGDGTAKVTWNVIDFPEGLEISVWDYSSNKPRQWEQDSAITFNSGKNRDIKIIVHNINSEPSQSLDFILRFVSMTPG